MSTGEVVVRSIETSGHTEYTPIGLTAHLAARLQAVAEPGSIAVSETIRRLCDGYFSFRSLGVMDLKGVGKPVEVFGLVGVGPLRTHFEFAPRRGLTKFVGREYETVAIQHALAQALDGHGQIFAVVAEAGTGKSRLFHEFKTSLPCECKLLEAYSVSHGKASAWLPVLELLRDYFDIREANDLATRREKVRAVPAALDPALRDVLPYVYGILGIQETCR